MRKLIIMALFTLPVVPVWAQWQENRDPNEQLEYMTDYQWNRWPHGFVLNDQFVKSPTGLHLPLEKTNGGKTIRGIGANNDSVEYHGNPYQWPEKYDGNNYISFNGFKCTQVTFYKEDYPYLVTLDQVREKYCPEVKGRVVYMINKFFVMDHEDLYRIDAPYIHKVETVSSKDIEGLADLPEFTIVRIFMLTSHNVFPEKTGISPVPTKR